MPDLVFSGATGKTYQYGVLEEGKMPTFFAGNFLFIQMLGTPIIVYAGESEGIFNTLANSQLWATAATLYKATHFCAHINPDEDARKAEQADLIKKHRPVMNGPYAPG